MAHCNQRTADLYKVRNFSSASLGTYTRTRVSLGVFQGGPNFPVSVTKTPLTPLKRDIDPTAQAVRTEEKAQLKGLNNRFASLIDQVRIAEQRNKMLETEWKLLQEQTTASSDMEPVLKAYISKLQRKLDMVVNDGSRLEQESNSMQESQEDFKTKWHDELNKRSEGENDYVILKKDMDAGYLVNADLEDGITGLQDEINFLRTLNDTEMNELQESLEHMSVVVQMDNSRALNMDRIVSEAKAHYEEIAKRSLAEAESVYKVKIDQMTSMNGQYNIELRKTKAEIMELKRLISRQQKELHSMEAQRSDLDDQISVIEQSGVANVKDALARIKKLKQVLQSDKHTMADHLKNYQELMNLKMAREIEIATYRKLLEGEEDRIGHQSIISIHNYNGLVVTKEEPEIVTINSTLQPADPEYPSDAVGKFDDPEISICYFPAPNAVVKFDEPEIAICDFPAPNPMVNCEKQEISMVFFKTTEILNTIQMPLE